MEVHQQRQRVCARLAVVDVRGVRASSGAASAAAASAARAGGTTAAGAAAALDRTASAASVAPALGLALLAGWALGGPGVSSRRKALAATVIGVHLSLTAMLFVYFYPILTGVVITFEQWFDRMWFSSWI